MLPAGVAVCPMNDATFRVPFILAPERHFISLAQAGYPRGDIDVVGDEQGLPRAKLKDETLMLTSIVVVGKDSLDHSPTFDLEVAGALFEGATQDSVAVGGSPALRARGLRRAAENAGTEQGEDENQISHYSPVAKRRRLDMPMFPMLAPVGGVYI